jgi:hypothetical protein
MLFARTSRNLARNMASFFNFQRKRYSISSDLDRPLACENFTDSSKAKKNIGLERNAQNLQNGLIKLEEKLSDYADKSNLRKQVLMKFAVFFSYSKVLMEALFHEKKYQLATETYDVIENIMKKHTFVAAFVPDIVFTRAIQSFYQLNNVQRTIEVLAYMEKYSQSKPRFQDYRLGLFRCILSYRFEDAKWIFNNMKALDSTASDQSLNLAIRVLFGSSISLPRDIMESTFKDLYNFCVSMRDQHNFIMSPRTQNILSRKHGSFQYFAPPSDESQKITHDPNESTYYSLISTAASSTEKHVSFDLFKKMISQGMIPTVQTYEILLKLILEQNFLHEAPEVLDKLQKHHHSHESIGFWYLVTRIYELLGHFDQSYELIKRISTKMDPVQKMKHLNNHFLNNYHYIIQTKKSKEKHEFKNELDRLYKNICVEKDAGLRLTIESLNIFMILKSLISITK